MKFIGEYYREKVLSLEPRAMQKRELPVIADDAQIMKGLFGWEIYSGKEKIECRSEAEARYLKVMAEFGYQEVLVPLSDEYIMDFLPELERICRKSMTIIGDILQTILNRKIREKIRYEVFTEITK
jgi:hypothetical protein